MANSDSNEIAVNCSVIKQVLLEYHPTLFLVERLADFAAAETHIEVCKFFVEYRVASKSWFDFPVPDLLRVEVEIFAKAARDYNARCKFRTKLRRDS